METSRVGRDPYEPYRIRVLMDGRAVAGFSKVSALKRVAPDAARTQPNFGRTEFEAITVERGVTHDPEFEGWARLAWKGAGGIDPRRPMKKVRRDLVIEVRDEAGRVSTRYQIFRCWVSAFAGSPHLEASLNAVAIDSMKIENEGWEREQVSG